MCYLINSSPNFSYPIFHPGYFKGHRIPTVSWWPMEPFSCVFNIHSQCTVRGFFQINMSLLRYPLWAKDHARDQIQVNKNTAPVLPEFTILALREISIKRNNQQSALWRVFWTHQCLTNTTALPWSVWSAEFQEDMPITHGLPNIRGLKPQCPSLLLFKQVEPTMGSLLTTSQPWHP